MNLLGIREVGAAFLRLGLTSFGGPIAHIGYFREAFVTRRRWLTDDDFAQLLAICQVLPGPASSQLGFAIGLHRAGWAGALTAFAAFTIPSILALLLFARLTSTLDSTLAQAAIAGLKLVAVAVVAHGLIGMARSLCQGWQRRSIAAAALAVLLLWPGAASQLAVVVGGAAIGLQWLSAPAFKRLSGDAVPRHGRIVALLLLAIFLAGLIVLPMLTGSWATLFDAFYRSGALVFGGGHVVLPLLEQALVTNGLLDEELFLAGYGAAQALPGPLFSVAAYYGQFATPAGGFPGAMLATLGIFLPGFLLVAAALPLWSQIPRWGACAVAGVNAAVVGLLAAAFWDPVLKTGITSGLDMAIAGVTTGGLLLGRLSPLGAVLACVTLKTGAALIT